MGVVQTVLAFNVVLLLALVLHLISTPLSDLIEAAGGYTSKTVCSNYFLSGRNQTYLQKELSEVFGAIASDIHEEEGYVISYLSIVGLEISQYLGMATPIAVYLGPSIGCRLTFAPVNESLALIASFDVDRHNTKFSPIQRDVDQSKAVSRCIQSLVDTEFTEEAYRKNGTRAVAVSLFGILIAEGYQEKIGINKNTRLLGWSMTKSLHATLVGVAIQKGWLYLNQLAELKHLNDEAQALARELNGGKEITMEDLLQMKDLLQFEENYKIMNDVTRMLYNAPNAAEYASSSKIRNVSMQSEKARQSGEASWYYSSGMSNILAEELRDYFDTYSEYLLFPQTELFAKIDAHSFALETDSSGTFTASSFGYATARDWTRLGELFLYSGMWRGEKIIPKNFVDYVRRPVVGSGGHYGASFWTNPNRVSVATYNELPLDHLDKQRKVWVTKNLPKDAYFMGGHLGQWVMIIPSEGLVISRLGFTREAVMKSLEWDSGKFFGSIVQCAQDYPHPQRIGEL